MNLKNALAKYPGGIERVGNFYVGRLGSPKNVAGMLTNDSSGELIPATGGRVLLSDDLEGLSDTYNVIRPCGKRVKAYRAGLLISGDPDEPVSFSIGGDAGKSKRGWVLLGDSGEEISDRYLRIEPKGDGFVALTGVLEEIKETTPDAIRENTESVFLEFDLDANRKPLGEGRVLRK